MEARSLKVLRGEKHQKGGMGLTWAPMCPRIPLSRKSWSCVFRQLGQMLKRVERKGKWWKGMCITASHG